MNKRRGEQLILPDMHPSEPCPKCGGSGRRLVPPPIGSGTKRAKGRRHGYAGTYSWGCRCELCRAAWREYSRTRKSKPA